MLHHGTELARSLGRGTLWLWTLRCCSEQTQEPAARAGWCRLSGHNLASWNAAGRRWTLSGNCEPLIRLRQTRARPLPFGSFSDYRAALLLPVSASCTDSPTVAVRCFGLSIRPLSVAASLAALTLTPSLSHSPSPLCLSHIPLLPLPPSCLTLLPASVPPISLLRAPEIAVPRSARCERRWSAMQPIVSAGDSSTVTITGKVRRRTF